MCTGGGAIDQVSSALVDVLTMMRHGERLDHVDKSWNGGGDLPATDSPLSPLGRLQAVEAALYLRTQMKRKKVRQRLQACCSYIVTSPFHRCVETAVILSIVGFDGSVPVYVDPLLADFLQGKVFSAPPKIGGGFTLWSDGERDKNGVGGSTIKKKNREDSLRFVPASLSPALAAIVQATTNTSLMSLFGVDDKTRERWTNMVDIMRRAAAAASSNLDGFNAQCSAPFGCLEVWTSDAMFADIVHRIQQISCPPSHSEEKSSSNNSPFLLRSLAFVSARHFPETPSIFADRVSQAVGLRFSTNRLFAPSTPSMAATLMASSSPPASTFSTIPRAVLDAEATDHSRTRGILLRTPRKYRFSAFPPANVLYVTHADTIANALELLVPRVANPYAGMAVPYASLTSIVKRNTYYTVPDLTRATSTDDDDARGIGSGGGLGPVRRNVVPPSWVAEDIGSTIHLQSKVFVRYSH